jgi:hypothetical protein
MMGTKVRSFAPLPHDLSLEDLVPQDNFYRRLEARLDLRLRRLRRVNVEALLIAAGQNIKRLLDLWGTGPRKLAQAEALRPPVPNPSVNGRLLPGSQRWISTPLPASFSTRWGLLRSSYSGICTHVSIGIASRKLSAGRCQGSDHEMSGCRIDVRSPG